MKSLMRCIVFSIFVLFACQNSFASTVYYGPAQNKITANSTKKRNASQVVLTNYTYDSYMAYATFPVNNIRDVRELAPFGSGRDIITYEIYEPDSVVCLEVIRNFDRATVYRNCLSQGYVDIVPYLNKSMPQIKISKTGK